MRTPVFSTAIALLLVLAADAGADHCEGYTTSEPEITLGPYYIDADCLMGPCMESLWVYEESNGIPGLQRDDEIVDDTCHGQIRGDTIAL